MNPETKSGLTRAGIQSTVFRLLKHLAPESDPAAAPPNALLREELDLDSMDILNFAIALHKEFGVEVPEGEYQCLGTMDSAVDYLAGHLGVP